MRLLAAVIFAMLLLVGPVMGQNLPGLAESQRDCAVCHLEWSPEFGKSGQPLLIDKPILSTAAREETCLGCHDGSILDSRKKVWQEQSHKTGQVPPVSMKVPANLPLENGKVACRTCHTAHNVPGSPNLSNIFFLRMPNEKSQLCMTCHTDKQSTAMIASHPLGKANLSTPAILTSAGAKMGPKGNELICQSCHEAHGSKADKLLVMPAGDNALCITCHAAMHPDRWGAQAASYNHPVNAPLKTEAQRQAIRDMKTHAGPNDTLACLSCHRLHNGPLNGRLLADTTTDSKLCLRCHADRASVANTVHDLRKSAPTTRNVLGQTIAESGPCGGCHLPHQSARDPMPMAGDPTGQCTTCHSTGRLAAKNAPHFNHPGDVGKDKLPGDLKLAVFTDKNHPGRASLVCTTCHDPHLAGGTKFLRKTPDELCASCHEQSQTLVGSHDFTQHPDARNGLGQTASESGKCGFCHDVHKGDGPLLWTATDKAPATPAELCTQCHSESGVAAKHQAPAYGHPLGVSAANRAWALPMFDSHGQRVDDHGTVQCASCHNPHSNSTQSNRMLRVTGTTSDLCLRCHDDKSSLILTRHDAAANPAWAAKKIGDDRCMACHLAHTNDAARREKLWAGPIDPTAVTANEQRCLGCHDNQNAPRPDIPVHPNVVFSLLDTAASRLPPGTYLPDQRSFACGVCHQPHGSNADDLKVLKAVAATQPTGTALQLCSAARPMIKENVATDICATCHGSDASRVFLYYHRPRQRQAVQMLQQPNG
jgi:predicted CXXCH cytochrome family protein